MEYFHWCEDMSMEPILDVWAGLGLGGLPPLVGADLEPYVEDAIREIEVSCLLLFEGSETEANIHSSSSATSTLLEARSALLLGIRSLTN